MRTPARTSTHARMHSVQAHKTQQMRVKNHNFMYETVKTLKNVKITMIGTTMR
jgi:hypothetical protein